MSILRSIILNDPKTAVRFMTGMSQGFWERSGHKRALEIFRVASTNVPAYREFLAENGVDPARVRTIEDFRSMVPVTDKAGYLKGRSMEELLAVPVSDTYLFYMSGGTTGDSFLTGAVRETVGAYPPSVAAMWDLQWGLCDRDKRVLLVNGMSLGAWIGGTMGTRILSEIAARHRNISFANPGADSARLLDLLEALHTHYDMIVLVSYPTFIKEVLHAGVDRGLDWPSMNVKTVVSGERLDDSLRQEIIRTISSPMDHHALIDQYGASEMGSPGSETPMASTIIRLARDNTQLCRDVFGTDEPRTLMQTNPAGMYIEVVDGRVLATAGTFMPIVRYSPKDLGRMFRYDEMLALLGDHGIDMARSLAEDGWKDKPLYKWPFLALSGRADYAVSVFGAMVAPESVRDLFGGDTRVRRFTMATDDSGPHTTLWVHIELRRGTTLPAEQREALAEHYRAAVLDRLLSINFDYRDAYAIHAETAAPNVAVHDYETGPFEAQQGAFKPKALG